MKTEIYILLSRLLYLLSTSVFLIGCSSYLSILPPYKCNYDKFDKSVCESCQYYTFPSTNNVVSPTIHSLQIKDSTKVLIRSNNNTEYHFFTDIIFENNAEILFCFRSNQFMTNKDSCVTLICNRDLLNIYNNGKLSKQVKMDGNKAQRLSVRTFGNNIRIGYGCNSPIDIMTNIPNSEFFFISNLNSSTILLNNMLLIPINQRI